jgi:Arc/MetJ-type ribon-helix-helix transcriptional regulator
MVRTTIRLPEEQFRFINQVADERQVSVSEVISLGMTDFLAACGVGTRQERIRRAMAVTRRFRSDKSDVSERMMTT